VLCAVRSSPCGTVVGPDGGCLSDVQTAMKAVCFPEQLSTSLQLVSRAVASRPDPPLLATMLTADADRPAQPPAFDLASHPDETAVRRGNAQPSPALPPVREISRELSPKSRHARCSKAGAGGAPTSLWAALPDAGLRPKTFPILPLVCQTAPGPPQRGYALVERPAPPVCQHAMRPSKLLNRRCHSSLRARGWTCAGQRRPSHFGAAPRQCAHTL